MEPSAPTDSDTSGMSGSGADHFLLKAGTVPGGVGSLSSTWTSGRYSPQSRNRSPPLPHDGHPHGPPGAPAGPSPLEVVQANNGLHLCPLPPWVGGGGVKPDRRRRLTPLPASCRRGDRCKGAGLRAQVRASVRVGAESHVSLSLLAATSLVSLLSDLHQGRGRVGAGRHLGGASRGRGLMWAGKEKEVESI